MKRALENLFDITAEKIYPADDEVVIKPLPKYFKQVESSIIHYLKELGFKDVTEPLTEKNQRIIIRRSGKILVNSRVVQCYIVNFQSREFRGSSVIKSRGLPRVYPGLIGDHMADNFELIEARGFDLF